MAGISRAMLAHKAWNKTATPEELALLEKDGQQTRGVGSGLVDHRQRLALLWAMVQVSRPVPPIVKAFR